jgi:hypothetical protein
MVFTPSGSGGDSSRFGLYFKGLGTIPSKKSPKSGFGKGIGAENPRIGPPSDIRQIAAQGRRKYLKIFREKVLPAN